MGKGEMQKKVFIWLLLLFFVAVATFMLIRVAGTPQLPGGLQKMLFISVSLLVLLFVLTILATYNSVGAPEKKPDEKQLESETAHADHLQKTSEPIHASGKKKQGRLVKKMRHLMANVESSSLEKLGDSVLSSMAREFGFVQGLFYAREKESESFIPQGRYAWYSIDPPEEVRMGDSITGQAAKDGKMIHLPNVPENYIQVLSGLGSSSPNHLYIVPLVKGKNTLGIMELASFKELDAFHVQVLQAMAEHLADILGDLSIKKELL